MKKLKKKKILIIDDEVNLAELVKTRLEFNEYYVVPCYTSKRGIEIAIREKPDAILLDIMMPDIDGYELCRMLKGNNATRDIPVILFTAKEVEAKAIKVKCKEVGAEDYILKPYNAKDLLDKIEKAIRR